MMLDIRVDGIVLSVFSVLYNTVVWACKHQIVFSNTIQWAYAALTNIYGVCLYEPQHCHNTEHRMNIINYIT